MAAKALLLVLALAVSLCLGQELNDRIDCEPEGQANQELCLQRGCLYEEVFDNFGVPWCFYPSDYGYSLEGEVIETVTGLSATLTRNAGIGSMVGGDFASLNVVAEFQTAERLRIKITPAGENRFEVPITIPGSGSKPADPLYDVHFVQNVDTFGIRVTRRSSGTVIFDSTLPGFVYADQYLQIASKLPSENVYGYGENEQHSYRHDLSWKTWASYARDQPPDGDANMYGTHPTYTVLENDGNAHTVLFLNSAAQELSLTPSPAVIFRTIGGILDIYFFLGPEPDDTNRQYTEAIGRYPLPPYWSLGFHLCKYGYDTLENMQATVDRNAAFNIPHDAQWGDIDIMDRALDFTISEERFGGLPEYVQELKSKGIKFVTILDPCISIGETDYRPFDLGNDMDVWTKEADGVTDFLGQVWPEDPTYFPDYSKPETKEWWIILLKEFKELLDYDALWIDMNEPANFVTGVINEGCANNNINFPPYKTRARGSELADKTLCGDAQHYFGSHYDTHNMFGWSESDCTLQGVEEATGQRGWVLSRSTFVGSGKWVAHWLGDNWSQWTNLHYSIIGMLQFNRFGIPHVGADICGFIGDSEEELCARWQQLGSFYPFSRNHNGLGYRDQDPASWGETVAVITRSALHYRYRFLPYLYTLFYKHWVDGSAVVHSLWDEFPRDTTAWGIDRQFLWGSGLLISPVLDQGATSVNAYFPDARWYDISRWIENNAITEVDARGEFVNLSGVVFPLQQEDINTEASRNNPWHLLVALDDTQSASGDLFVDDGTSQQTVQNRAYFLAHFAASGGELTSTVQENGYAGIASQVLEGIDIVGISGTVTDVTVNGEAVTDFTYANGRLTISGLAVSIGEEITVTYS